jgi:hypothetical protein
MKHDETAERDRGAAEGERLSGGHPGKPLGGWEAFFHRAHEELFGGPAVLCVSARIAGPLDIQLVKHACHHVWARHPSLKARIVSAEGGFSFLFNVPFNDIPIHSFFELGRTDLHTVVEREVDTLFDASKHLWRVLLITDRTDLERHYLLLSLHHSISDGTSAVHLAEELLLCCTRILAGETPRMDPLPLRASLEEFLASAERGGGKPFRRQGHPPATTGAVRCPSTNSSRRAGGTPVFASIPCRQPKPPPWRRSAAAPGRGSMLPSPQAPFRSCTGTSG